MDFAMELLIGEGTDFAGLAFPDDGGLVLASGLHVAVEAVVGEIDLSSYKPLGPRAIPFENLVPLLEPVQFAGDARPELVGIVNGLFVEAIVLVEALDVGFLGEFGRTLELALLVQDGIDVRALGIRFGKNDGFLGHDEDLDAEAFVFVGPDRAVRNSKKFIVHMRRRDVIAITRGPGCWRASQRLSPQRTRRNTGKGGA